MQMMNQAYSLNLAEQDHYLAAEQAVLGSVLLDNDVMDHLSTMLEPSDFSTPRHELLWKAMLYRYNRNEPTDLLTLTEALVRYKRIEEVGGVAYLSELANATPTASNARYYAPIVKEFARKRRGLELSDKIRELTVNGEYDSAEDYYGALDKLVMQMRPDTTGKMRNFADTEEEYFRYLATQMDTIKTGFKQFDDWSGGIGNGWLYILAGRPSIGKTAKVLQMSGAFAKQNVGEILVWSQEMTFNQLKNRILASSCGVNYGRIRKKNLDDHEIEKLRMAHKEFNNFPFYVEDSCGVTIDHIRSTARQMKRRSGKIGAIVVDYLTKMDIRQEKGQTWSRAVGEVSKKAKWLAQEMECPFIMLAQLSREGAEGEPQLHHLRDSGEIEQDADVVEFLSADPDEKSNQGVVVRSTIAKGREIGTRTFQYLFKGHVQRYEDYNG